MHWPRPVLPPKARVGQASAARQADWVWCREKRAVERVEKNLAAWGQS